MEMRRNYSMTSMETSWPRTCVCQRLPHRLRLSRLFPSFHRDPSTQQRRPHVDSRHVRMRDQRRKPHMTHVSPHGRRVRRGMQSA